MNNNILVIVAHPDDEILGCGGTVAKHVSQGDNVTICIVCEGESHRKISQDKGAFIDGAAKILGVINTIQLKFSDQKLDTIPLVDIVSKLEDVVNQSRPKIVYSHFKGDINKDHQIVFDAMLVATRPMLSYIRSIYAFNTSSSTEWGYPRSFIPDTWIDISEYIDIKLEAMKCYKTEVEEYPHPRSIKALRNKATAEGNQCLMEKAETFMTIRRCIRSNDRL